MRIQSSNGAILREARRAAGLSQAQLGRRISYSAATVSRFETGRRPLTDVVVLRSLAAALNVPPDVFGLVGEGGADRRDHPTRVSRIPTGVGSEDTVQRREVLAGMVGLTGAAVLGRASPAGAGPAGRGLESFLVGPMVDAAPIPLAELSRSVIRSRMLFDQCRYGELADVLPRVIPAATATQEAADGRTREVASRLLADCYRTAAELSVKINDDGLALIAADRARSAAQASGDPATTAGAARSTAIALRRLGHPEGAARLLTSTAAGLDVDGRATAPATVRSYGALLCTAAYSLAQQGRRSTAIELIAEAHQAAARLAARDGELGAAVQAHVLVYRIGIHTAFGESATALRHAAGVDQRWLLTAERRARFEVDTARAWDAHGRSDLACAHLLVAERHAPEDLRRPSVVAFLAALLQRPGRRPPGLSALARRSGVPRA